MVEDFFHCGDKPPPKQVFTNGAMTGGKGRRPDNFYPTPWTATEAFLRREAPYLKPWTNRIWEPACGDGAICKVIEAHGFNVHGSDLRDRGYGEAGRDFLKTQCAWRDAIITNPPYGDDLPEKFIRHAHAIGVRYVAFLLKAQYWHVKSRLALWRDFRPVREYPLAFRLDFLGQGGGPMDCTWWVWDFHDEQGFCEKMDPLERPACIGTGDLLAQGAEKAGAA